MSSSQFDCTIEVVNERPTFERVCIIRSTAQNFLIAADSDLAAGYDHLPRVYREIRVLKRAFILFNALGCKPPDEWDRNIFPAKGWPDDITAALEKLRDSFDRLVAHTWMWPIWEPDVLDQAVRNTKRNSKDEKAPSESSEVITRENLKIERELRHIIDELKYVIKTTAEIAEDRQETRDRLIQRVRENSTSHREHTRQLDNLFDAPLFKKPARIDGGELAPIAEAVTVLERIGPLVVETNRASQNPTNHIESTQADYGRAKHDLKADDPSNYTGLLESEKTAGIISDLIPPAATGGKYRYKLTVPAEHRKIELGIARLKKEHRDKRSNAAKARQKPSQP